MMASEDKLLYDVDLYEGWFYIYLGCFIWG